MTYIRYVYPSIVFTHSHTIKICVCNFTLDFISMMFYHLEGVNNSRNNARSTETESSSEIDFIGTQTFYDLPL